MTALQVIITLHQLLLCPVLHWEVHLSTFTECPLLQGTLQYNNYLVLDTTEITLVPCTAHCSIISMCPDCTQQYNYLCALNSTLQYNRFLLLDLLDDWSLPVKQIKIKYDIFSISEHIEKFKLQYFKTICCFSFSTHFFYLLIYLSIYLPFYLSSYLSVHLSLKHVACFFLVFSLRPCHFEFIALISNKILWQGRRVKMILHKKKEICFAHFAKSVFACLHPTIKGMFGKLLVHQFSCIFYSLSESFL